MRLIPDTRRKLKVTLLGTGTSYPDRNRVQSGILIEAGGKYLLFDVGSGILHRITQAINDLTSVKHIFLSHFHIDHCSDFVSLCQTLWLSGFRDKLKVYGPPAMDKWWEGVFETAFDYLMGRFPIILHRLNPHDEVNVDDIKITCVPSCHGDMDSRAYRIDYDNSSIVYSSDTAPCDEIAELAAGVDLLVHECNWLDGEHLKKVHTSPSELSDIVARAQPATVVLVHMSPDVVQEAESVLDTIKGQTSSSVILGQDLMEIRV